MSTNNPFGKLKIQRDEDEEEIKTSTQTGSQQQSSEQSQDIKKKKRRPEKKEEPSKEEEDDGFETVIKHKQTKKKQTQEPTDTNEDLPTKTDFKKRQEKGPLYNENKKPKKRPYDRRSGTGRGREVAKNGAGGRGTWGDNPKNIAHYYERNNDEYIMEQALNPRPKREVKEEEYEEQREEEQQKEDEQKEEQQKEETKEEPKEEPKEDIQYERKDDRRVKKKNPKEEGEKKDLFNIPENAISVNEYLAQKKSTQVQSEEKVVQRPKETENLKVQEKKEEYTIGTSGVEKKKGKGPKNKKEKKEDVNFEIKIGEERELYKQRGRGGRGYNRGNQRGGFKFNPEDFPELK